MGNVIDNVKDAVKRDISTGKYDRSKRLPGFRELAEIYQCSRGTIENAIRTLADSGLVYTTHGRGTFIADRRKKKLHYQNRIVGAILLRCSWMEAMEELRKDYLKEGWFVSTYCASDDLQDPSNEARFLSYASEQHFAAVILVGTPKPPLNTELYKKLRREGMKVLHLSHYQVDMSRENAILPDYEAAGRLAVSKAAVAGYRKICFVSPDTELISPSTALRRNGAIEMARGLDLEFTECSEEDMLTRKTVRNSICLFESASGAMVFRKHGRKDPVMLLAGTDPDAVYFDRISFDYKESIRLAMDYVMDETIQAASPFCRMLPPKFYSADNVKNKHIK